MDVTIIYLILIVTGLCMGSFAAATAWRLRSRQLFNDKKSGEKVNQAEYNKLNKLNHETLLTDHSRCLDCSYRLKWYDLIPVISWLLLKGRCRKCRKPIGWTELLAELIVAGFFVVSYIFWPFVLTNGLEISRFILWLAAGVVLAILFIYDKKWFLLPDIANYAIIGLGAISTVLIVIGSVSKIDAFYSILGSVFILSGIYYVLYIISKGKWIGFGDIKLGLGLGLLLADWKLAFIALFTANLIGCLLVIPGLLLGKLKRNSHISFGPLLIIGAIIAMLAGNHIINLYLYGIL